MRTRPIHCVQHAPHEDPAQSGGVFAFSGCKEILQFFVTIRNLLIFWQEKTA